MHHLCIVHNAWCIYLPDVSWIMHHTSPFQMHHASFIIYPASYIMHNVLCIMHHSSDISHHASFIMHDAYMPFRGTVHLLSRFIMYHVSCIIHHSLCIILSAYQVMITEEWHSVLPLQWFLNNWQKSKEIQTHGGNSISFLWVFQAIVQLGPLLGKVRDWEKVCRLHAPI